MWSLWDSNPSVTVQMSSASHYTTDPKQCLTSIVGLRRSIRLDKTTATLNGRMANVVGYFVPLHSLTTLATHMYIFECCLRPTSGNVFKSMQRYIKYLRNQNFQRTFFAGEVGFEPTTNRLTVYCANRCATPQSLQ